MDDIDAEILKAQRELEALQGDVDIDEEIKRAELELESLKGGGDDEIEKEIAKAQAELKSLSSIPDDIDEEIRAAERELQNLERERERELKLEAEKRKLDLKRTETETARLSEIQKKKDEMRRKNEEEERRKKQIEKEEEERRVIIAKKIEEERKKKLEAEKLTKGQEDQKKKLEEEKKRLDEIKRLRKEEEDAKKKETDNSQKKPQNEQKTIDISEIARLQKEMISQRKSLIMEKLTEEYEDAKPNTHPFMEQYPNCFSEDSEYQGVEVTPDVSFKVIVIGDSGVGKSNILNRWVKGCFGNDTIIATTQCAFHLKTFKMTSKDNSAKDKIVAVQLWDTAGQERFLSLTRQFFRGAVGVVVVYDTTARESFTHIQKWIYAVEEEGTDANMILIGNKTDLVHQREVEKGEGIQFAQKNNMAFLETSALDGSNCSKALQILMQDIYHKQTSKNLSGSNDDSNSINSLPSQVLSSGPEETSECAC